MFSYHEKIEYWAYIVGNHRDGGLSGFCLVVQRLVARVVAEMGLGCGDLAALLRGHPGDRRDLIWHLYGVLFDPDVYPMEKDWITGRVSADHLKATRPALLRATDAEGR